MPSSRLAAGIAGALAFVVLTAVPAGAHVTVSSTDPTPGGFGKLVVRVPTEPITAEGFTLSKAVATVTWTASGADAGIAPGEFDEFELSLGSFPSDADTLSFPTTQTHSDGTVVNWDQPSVEGQDEPEHPVPTLELAAAPQAADPAPPTTDFSDSTARWLAGTAMAVAAAALVPAGLAAFVVVGRRRSPA